MFFFLLFLTLLLTPIFHFSRRYARRHIGLWLMTRNGARGQEVLLSWNIRDARVATIVWRYSGWISSVPAMRKYVSGIGKWWRHNQSNIGGIWMGFGGRRNVAAVCRCQNGMFIFWIYGRDLKFMYQTNIIRYIYVRIKYEAKFSTNIV